MVRERLTQPRRRRFGEWGVLLLLALVSLVLFTPRIYGADEIKYFAPLRSFYFDGDFHYENEYAYFIERDPVAHAGLVPYRDTVTSTGYRLNDGTIGAALLWSPFYIAADVYVVVTGWFGSEVPRDGYSSPYIWAVCLGSMFWGTGGLFLTYRLCREYADTASSTAAIVGIWFATPVVFYLYITPPMGHANSLFAVSLFVFIWLHTRDERQMWEWIVLGASAGLMVLVRELNGVFLLAPFVDELFEAWDAYRVARVESALDSRGLITAWWGRFKQLFHYEGVSSAPEPEAPKPPPTLRYRLGLGVFIFGNLLAVTGMLLPAFGFANGRMVGVIAVILVAGEIISWSSIVLLGKEGFKELKTRLFSVLKRTPSGEPVSLRRHRVGGSLLALHVAAQFLALVFPIAAHFGTAADGTFPTVLGLHRPEQLNWFVGLLVASEALFFAGVYTLGADWWGRFRALFRS